MLISVFLYFSLINIVSLSVFLNSAYMCICIYILVLFNFFCGTCSFASARVFPLPAKFCMIFLEPSLIPLYPELITLGILVIRNKYTDITKDFLSTIHAMFVLSGFWGFLKLYCEFFVKMWQC